MKRILFIDDEPALLNGLKRSLRGQRKEWDMTFAGDGPSALEIAKSEAPFDLVMTDMRMPVMDGAEVLRRMQEISPGTIRFVLSGQAELDLAMRVATTAHQYFTKPLESQNLQEGITTAIQLHEVIESPVLRGIVGSISSLPVLPATYKRLQSALTSEEVSLDEVTDIVTQDSGLAAKILQLVNSSYFGLPRQLDSLRESINYIGLTNLKTLVLNYGLVEQFQSCSAAKSFDPEQEQERMLCVGSLAKFMHGKDRRKADQAFLAGMLHRIGRLVMATSFAEELDQIEDAVRGNESLRFDAELKILGATHCEIGAYLLGSWGLPHDIMQAALSYLEPTPHSPTQGLSICGSVGLAHHLLQSAAGLEPTSPLEGWLPADSPLRSQIGDWQQEAGALLAGPTSRAA